MQIKYLLLTIIIASSSLQSQSDSRLEITPESKTYVNRVNQRFLLNGSKSFDQAVSNLLTLPHSSNVVIKVYDFFGNEKETLVREEKPAGTYEKILYTEKPSSGIFVYRLQVGDFIETKKMILIK